MSETGCRACKSELPSGATKCHQCGSFQDWRASIESTQLLIGFLLLVVTFLAIDPVKKVFLGDQPEIHATILKANSETVWVMASNDGNGPAALVSLRITANTRARGAWETVLAFDSIPERLIKPKEIKIIAMRHNHQIPEIVVPGVVVDESRSTCNLVIHYYELQGHHVMASNEFKCYLERKQ